MEQASVVSKRNLAILGFIILAAISLVIVSYFIFLKRDPIKELSNEAGFVIYEAPIPEGYKLDTSSIKLESGSILFYTLSSGNKTISISQQVTPVNKPDFKTLAEINTSIKSLSTNSGDAIIGINDVSPIAIISTNTTLINISASRDVPQDIIRNIVNTMHSIN